MAQKDLSEDFYSLTTLKTKGVALDEIWVVKDSLLLAVGHKHRFNYFYVYELKTFKTVFDTSITSYEKFDGSLSFTYYIDSTSSIFFPKETFQNIYFEINLQKDTIQIIPCYKTPEGCIILERRASNKIAYSENYNFAYQMQKDGDISVFVAKPYFNERKKALNLEMIEMRKYLQEGKR